MLVSARNTFLALAVLVCPALLAQDTGVESNLPGAGFGPDNTSQSSTPVPTLHVFTRETLVDITITDANGKPVRGLKQSDFTVLEDKQLQSIRSFHEFDANTVEAPTPSPQLPPNVYTNLKPASGPLNVFLFDDINGGDGIRARSGLEAFIKKMEPGTQVALLGIGDHLTVLHGPTSDQASLLQVAEAAVKPFAIEATGCTARIFMDWATLDQLRELATYLSGIEGKKNVIWVGKGIAEMVFLGGCQDWALPLQQTYDLLEDAQATLYPLDPGGVGPLGRKQLAMEAVAEATGGSAYYERNDLDYLMSEAVDAGSAYYSLSYAPRTTAYDGRYHNISITVDRLAYGSSTAKATAPKIPRA